MLLVGKKIVFGLTSAQYTFNKTIPQISKLLAEGSIVIPAMSFDAYYRDTKFGKASEFIEKIERQTFQKVINSNEDIENLDEIDLMVICPCSRKCIRKNCKWDNGYTYT